MGAADIERWYRRYFPLIREKCRRMLGDFEDAQDLAQDTFVRLWRAELPLDDSRRVTAWVYKTATRLAIDRLRARSVRGEDARPADADAAEPSPEPTPADVHPDAALDARRLLRKVAASMPADELECALLDRLDGLTHAESAEVLGVSERTVRRMLGRFDERVARLQEHA